MARDTSFFTTIKEQVDLEDYLTNHLNVELVPDGPGRMAACCPFHEEDTPSFKVTDSNDGPWKRWYCYGACQTGGTVIDAVMRAENYELAHEAAQYLNDLYDLGLDMNSEAYQAFKRTVAETRQDIERTRKTISGDDRAAQVARNYLANRGFSEETIEHFQLGVDISKTKAGRLSIPLIDKANHPVSIANRALFDRAPCQACGEVVEAKEMVKQRFTARKAQEKGEENIPDWKRCPRCGAEGAKAKLAWLTSQHPKYLYLRDFDKAQFLYHENSTRHALKDENVIGLFAVEGYADVWAGWQSGHQAIVAYNGSSMSEWQAQEMVELAVRAGKPIVLVPDFDDAGERNIDRNIRQLRAVKDDVEVQVVYGVDRLTYREPGVDEDKRCKDLGEVLQHHGADEVHRILRDQRQPAAEWMIRQLVEHINPRTGEPFHSEQRQMQLVAEVLSHEKAKVSLDHLIPYLAGKWNKTEEIIRQWFYSNLSEDNVSSYRHLFKDIEQARVEAREFLQDDNVIPLGFKGIDQSLPGGGVRPGQLSMVLGKSGTGKTMLASQILAHMADSGTRSIIFSLEQAAKSLFSRLACQALDLSMPEVEELIARDDESAERQLEPVREIYKNMLIVDNVPEAGQEALAMTPQRIQAIIQEANMTHFKGKPASVVIIDHLGILEVDPDAPREIKGSEHAAAGYIMKQLFAVCKATSVFMVVLQQLPKEIPPGEPFGYDAGRGGSAQTDFCDYIFQVWRPEQEQGIEDEERVSREGKYMLALGKNRYGPSTVEHLHFDKATLRIMPALEATQPHSVNLDGPVIEVEGEEPAEEAAEQSQAVKGRGEVGASAESLGNLAEESDPLPQDNQALAELTGFESLEEMDAEEMNDIDLSVEDEDGLIL